MPILVIAEHDGKTINAATRATIAAAQQILQQTGGDIHVLVVGNATENVAANAVKMEGVSKVITAQHATYTQALSEPIAALIASIASNYSHVMMGATSMGKDIMPRLSALIDMQQISEITKVVAPDTFVRPIYAGNALETVQSMDRVKVITVRATAFDKAADKMDGSAATIESLAPIEGNYGSRFEAMQMSESTRPELASARVVISGGRGLGSAENFALIERLADKLGAAIGASRAAVDAGYVPNDYQVGQTGKVVAPELYIAVGISGAIQHLAGMKESKVIVAINKDENAPIFEIADYGLVGDLFEILPQLEAAL